MIYRIVCRFSDTEAAQVAARRMRSQIADIYEIRLQYRSDRGRDGVPNNIVYASASNVTFPIRSMNGNGMFFFRSTKDGFPDMEFSDECMMSVIAKNNERQIAGIMVNSGGFDIKTHQEQNDAPEIF